MSHLLIVELPGGNDTDILEAAFDAGHRFTLLTAESGHYLAQPDVAGWLARAEAVIEVPDFAVDAVMAKLAGIAFDAILCLQDLRIAETACIAQALGLRHLNPATAALARDKSAIRARLAEAGLAQPDYAVTMGVDDLLATVDRLGLPLIIKPVDGFGSQHVFALRDDGDLDTLRALAGLVSEGPGSYGLGVAAQGRLLVERLLNGTLIGCDTMSADGRHVLLGVNEKLFYPPPSFAIRGGCLTTNSGQYGTLEAWLIAVLDAIGFNHGAAHVEVMLTPEGPQLVEVNPRMVGARIARLISAARGQSAHADLIALHLSGRLPRPAALNHAVTRWLTAPTQGILTQITLPNSRDPGGAEVMLLARVGDRVQPPFDNADRLGYVMTCGRDRSAIEALADRTIEEAHVRVDHAV